MKNQNGEDKDYVLDSSAFLTLFEDEEGAETVQELLERAKKEEVAIFVCFATFVEVFLHHISRAGTRGSSQTS